MATVTGSLAVGQYYYGALMFAGAAVLLVGIREPRVRGALAPA
jgi:hypothetical protein